MFDEIDRAYYLQRAKDERANANDATNDCARKAHEALAAMYERKAQKFAREKQIVGLNKSACRDV